MRLALLCDDASVGPWLDALTNDESHELVIAAAINDAAAELLRGRSGIRLTPHWEDLVGANRFDAVIVGGSDAQVLEAIKQLATSGQSLLFLPSAAQGSTFIYELSLIRDDNRVAICPAVWHRCDPALRQLRESIRDASLGQVQLVQVQRELVQAGPSSSIAQQQVDEAMLLDFDLLRWLIGDFDQVTALRTGATETGVITQSVKLAGRGLPEATWDVRAGKQPQWRATIHTDRGVTVLERDVATAEWGVIDPDGVRRDGNRREAVLDFLRNVETAGDPPIEWGELVKAFETIDATHRSVRRRRTIELHFEPMSERAIFKTQMTAIGCSVLIATFLLVLLYLGIASTVPLPRTALLVLRTLIFAPLGLFLVLQLLYPLTRPSEAAGNGPGPHA